jgi:hypothetical protein
MLPLPLLYGRAFTLRLTLGVLDRDVFALIRFEDGSDVGWCKDADGWEAREGPHQWPGLAKWTTPFGTERRHGLTFKERNQVDQPLVTRLTIPRLDDDGVLRLKRYMFGIGVDEDYL